MSLYIMRRRAWIIILLSCVVLALGTTDCTQGTSNAYQRITITSHTSPTPRYGLAIAYFPPKKEVVLFGGQDLNSGRTLGDLWVFDRHGWRELHPALSPSARGQAAIAFDPKIGEVVLYGGCTFCGAPGYALVQDTWAFNGSTWRELRSWNIPSYEPSPLMAWDTATQALELLAPPPGYGPNPPNGDFGSYDATQLGRWSWTDSGWTWQGNSTGPPLFIQQSAFVSEPGTTKMLYFSYQPYSGSCSAPPRREPTCGYDPTGKLYQQTWTWNGFDFSQNSPRGAPAYSGAVVSDVRIGRVTAVAGSSVWLWNGATWVKQRSPAPSFQSIAAAYDADLGELIDLAYPPNQTSRTVTWAWDGTNWLPTSPS